MTVKGRSERCPVAAWKVEPRGWGPGMRAAPRSWGDKETHPPLELTAARLPTRRAAGGHSALFPPLRVTPLSPQQKGTAAPRPVPSQRLLQEQGARAPAQRLRLGLSRASQGLQNVCFVKWRLRSTSYPLPRPSIISFWPQCHGRNVIWSYPEVIKSQSF